MAKLWKCKWDGPTVDIPTMAVWCDLSVVALESVVGIYQDSYEQFPTTVLYSTDDGQVAAEIRYKAVIGSRLPFWVPVPGMPSGAFIVLGKEGFAMSAGA